MNELWLDFEPVKGLIGKTFQTNGEQITNEIFSILWNLEMQYLMTTAFD